jgi:CRISPR-associated endonuclease/helicase Cas3
MLYLAHSKNASGQTQLLLDHLHNTESLAEQFASKWDAGSWGRWAGLLHDIGKFSDRFQRYIREQEAKGGDHSSAGALLACQNFDRLAFPIAGHHGGLQNKTALKVRLRSKLNDVEIQQSIDRAQEILSNLKALEPLPIPEFILKSSGHSSDRSTAFFLRMVFSALVDADFLDTERHFQPDQAEQRSGYPTLKALWECFERNQDALIKQVPQTPTNGTRERIYRACLQATSQEQGFFSLTVPTGGGKTRSGMGFALKHALAHNLDRVIVVIPYTSIIDQTADEYRKIFGIQKAVLEHHSAINVEKQGHSAEEGRRAWWELAAENWDAPIVVTTTVQFFESLFSNQPSRCRKLHNISRSVVILDEVQTLPEGLLVPILDGLRELVQHYRTSVVLSTATQPAFSAGQEKALRLECVREIAPQPTELFSKLKRVRYRFESKKWSWEQVAEAMIGQAQAMAVVNTRADARALFRCLPPESRMHLSSSLCGAHRRTVLEEVRRRLYEGEPCRLVSTQVVEAGVDLDFPLALRAVGPLDRIVQAAGRCNREGKLVQGEVIVFEPEEGGIPPGAYRSGADATRTMLNADPELDLHNPATYERYFQRLYQAVTLDAKEIQTKLARLAYEDVAREFHLISEDSVSVAIPWQDGERLLQEAEHRPFLGRDFMRKLQLYLVNIHRWQHEQALTDGRCKEIIEGLWRWNGSYDAQLGLIPEGHQGQDLMI